MKKYIPNFFTCLNIFSGCVGIYYAFDGNFRGALLAVLIAATFDFLDGFMARLLGAFSSIGKELDSLADMVSFGVLPGAIVFSLLSKTTLSPYIHFFGFIIPIFSALRLAKFNTSIKPTRSFTGIPTPANAIFWGGMAFTYADFLSANVMILIVLCMLFSYLLIADIPMFGLKFYDTSWKNNNIQYFFLIGCVAIFWAFRLDMFPFLIIWYVVLSVSTNILRKKMVQK